MHVCPKVEPGPVPHVGGPTSSGEKTVIIGGMRAARIGDSLVCFGGPPDSISQGESTVIIGGKPAARLGDSTSHGGVLVAGCPTVIIGSSAQAQTVILAARNRTPFCEECEKKKVEEEGSRAEESAGVGSTASGSGSALPASVTNKTLNSANGQEPPRARLESDCNHSWRKVSAKTVEATLKKNAENAAALRKSPSREGSLRGCLFENTAIAANMRKIDIQETSAIYECTKCPAKQEVDIVGKNQIAEAKSRNARGTQRSKPQATRLVDIQAKLFDPSKKPLAKLDGSLSDVKDSEAIYLRRGFEVEIVS
jgi:uncharacterized Zn-binding protein involved in type VI secretion